MKAFYGINFEAFEDFLKGKLPYAWSRLFTSQFLLKKEQRTEVIGYSDIVILKFISGFKSESQKTENKNIPKSYLVPDESVTNTTKVHHTYIISQNPHVLSSLGREFESSEIITHTLLIDVNEITPSLFFFRTINTDPIVILDAINSFK